MTTTGSPVPATSTSSSSSPTDTIVRRTIDRSLAYAKRNVLEADRPISAQRQSRLRA
jgi:hypothetical protein